MTPRLSVKFRPNRFRFAGVIPEKVIRYDLSVITGTGTLNSGAV